MKSTIFLENYENHHDLVIQFILETPSKNITHIEYRGDGFRGACEFIVLPKSEVNDFLEAFVTLLNYDFHNQQEWPLPKTKEEAELVASKEIIPEVSSFDYEKLDELIFQEEPILKTRMIIEDLKKPGSDQRDVKFPRGIYKNGKRVENHTSLKDFGISDMTAGLCLTHEWDACTLLYETTHDYVYFAY